MKKVILIGLILAILLLAFPQGVMAATDTAAVSATIADYIFLDVTGPTSAWPLEFTHVTNECDAVPECNQLTNAISFAINTNDAWFLTAKQDSTGQVGRLLSGSTYLTNPLYIGPNTANNYVTVVSADQLLESGTTVGVITPFTKNLRQTLAIGDQSALGTYSITLTFDATTAP